MDWKSTVLYNWQRLSAVWFKFRISNIEMVLKLWFLPYDPLPHPYQHVQKEISADQNLSTTNMPSVFYDLGSGLELLVFTSFSLLFCFHIFLLDLVILP